MAIKRLLQDEMVGTGRFELPTPRTPSECSTRLSHVPTRKEPAADPAADGVYPGNFITSAVGLRAGEHDLHRI